MLRYLCVLLIMAGMGQVSHAQDAITGQPHWSPDGQRVLYTSNESGSQQIYSVKTDGMKSVRITQTTSNESNPSFSPDGTQILFTSDRDGNVEIYLRDRFKRGRSCKLRRVSKYWHKNAPCQANAKPIPATSPRNNGATLNRFYQSPRPIRSPEDARRATFERSSMASCMSSGADVNGA